MTKIPVAPAKKIEKAVIKLGFVRVRQKGSHVFYRHPDGRTTTIPWHKGRDIAPVLLKKILKDINTDIEVFIKLLNQ